MGCDGIFTITSTDNLTREKGYYGILYARPSNLVRNTLLIDRELLILISTFNDQQSRTIQTAREVIAASNGRLEANTFVVVHRDPQGNSKLRSWGREQSLVVLPIFYDGRALPVGVDFLRLLAHEMFSHDPFDVTGPVADDVNFYGRREEARELAKRLQTGQIRSCFGVRKIGKTSIIHRMVREIKDHYDCEVLMVDGERDSIFTLDAGQLLNSIAVGIGQKDDIKVSEIRPQPAAIDVSSASEKLLTSVLSSEKPIVIIFDEIDYLTPGSPTAPHWHTEFNIFWRNVRAVYQQASLSGRPFSIFVSGVSSKWFSVESIDGVENAALALIPEEYLSPLPRGAAMAMIRRLGKLAGLTFTDNTANLIAETCAEMPFWIRKACSFIHSKIDVGLRPFEPQKDLVEELLRDFIVSDGSAMSSVALSHLFRVYPELRAPTVQCFNGEGARVPKPWVRVLEKYGITKGSAKPSVVGLMMRNGVELVISSDKSNLGEQDMGSGSVIAKGKLDIFGEWADELAIIGRRRNLIENKIRGICTNFIRYTSLGDQTKPAKERILICLDAKRRQQLNTFDLDTITNKLFWLELAAIIKKEWALLDVFLAIRSNFNPTLT